MLPPSFLHTCLLAEHGKLKSPWLKISATQQQLKHQCVINIILTQIQNPALYQLLRRELTLSQLKPGHVCRLQQEAGPARSAPSPLCSLVVHAHKKAAWLHGPMKGPNGAMVWDGKLILWQQEKAHVKPKRKASPKRGGLCWMALAGAALRRRLPARRTWLTTAACAPEHVGAGKDSPGCKGPAEARGGGRKPVTSNLGGADLSCTPNRTDPLRWPESRQDQFSSLKQ